MIKKLIGSLKSFRTVFIPKSEFVGKPKEIKKTQPSYVGVPAPVISPEDSWFDSAPKTEKVMEYVQKKNEELYQKLAEGPKSKEPENIHQVMYERATKNVATTLALNPIGGSENFQGGSENIQR